MGQKQIYMKRRPGNYCMVGWDNSRILSAEPCMCRAHDFEWWVNSTVNNMNPAKDPPTDQTATSVMSCRCIFSRDSRRIVLNGLIYFRLTVLFIWYDSN